MVSPLAIQPPDKLGVYLKSEIDQYLAGSRMEWANNGVKYYNQENDIEKKRIFYENDHGEIVEDTQASNIKISHGFFTELVDQMTQYLLSNGVSVYAKDEENAALNDLLEEYYDEDFQSTIEDIVTGASKKGYEGIFARTTSEDKLTFQSVDGRTMLPVYDNYGALIRVVVFSTETRWSTKYRKTVDIGRATVWTDTECYYYVQDSDGQANNYILDPEVTLNPQPHIIMNRESDNADTDTTGYEVLGRHYEAFPFQILYNNKEGYSDVKRVKALIDDYDLMNCFLSNNLQDFSEAIYVVKGFQGQSIDKLRRNIKAKKVMGTAPDGGMDIQTVQIPYEARRTKMELDEVNIYRSGMGFNSNQVGDGNVTNVVIKSRYTLLAMRARKLETSLRKILRWTAELVCADIARRGLGQYKSTDIVFEIEPYVLANESDLATIKLTNAQALNQTVDALLKVAPRISDKETLKAICEEFGLDYDEVVDALEEQDEEALEATPEQLQPFVNRDNQGQGEDVVDEEEPSEEVDEEEAQ